MYVYMYMQEDVYNSICIFCIVTCTYIAYVKWIWVCPINFEQVVTWIMIVYFILQQRQVFSALSQISKHSVDLADMVVEAEVFPTILTSLKGTIDYVSVS